MRPRRQPKLAQVHRDTVLSVLGSFGIQAMVLVSGVLVARILGVENRGHLALLWLVCLILGQLGTLGLPLAVTYWIAEEPRSASAIVRSLVAPIAFQVVFLVGLQALALWLLIGDENDSVRLAALVTLPLLPAVLVQQYALAILQGQRRFRAFNLFRPLPSTLYAAGVSALFLAEAGDLPRIALTFTTVYALGACVAIGYALAGLTRSIGASAAPRRSEMLRFGLKGMFGSVSPLDTFQLDQAVVGLFISPAALGLYVAGLALTNLPRFVAQSIGIVAFPHVAAHNDLRLARRAIWRFVTLALVVCGAIVGALEAAAGWLVPLFFGDEFAEAVDITRILLISTLLVGIRRVLADAVRGAGNPGLGALAEVAAWISLFPTLAILAPIAGVEGVALSLVVSAALGIVVLLAALAVEGRRGSPQTLIQPPSDSIGEVPP
jgi:O-antigen/teichoic acid export membrane protein